MAAQRGKDILLKISDGGGPAAFVTVAGLRARTLSLNARTIDVTDGNSSINVLCWANPEDWRAVHARTRFDNPDVNVVDHRNLRNGKSGGLQLFRRTLSAS